MHLTPLLLTCCITPMLSAQLSVHPRLMEGYWGAQWIAAPADNGRDYGVYHFRRSFDLEGVPDTFIIHVSADQRYKLWINGSETGKGPARGDLGNWPFESYDIAPLLQPGRNVIAAQVWNAGEEAPMAQFSLRTAFLLQADDGAHGQLVNTGPAWRVLKSTAYQPVGPDHAALRTYIVVGPGDRIDGAAFPWGWTEAGYPDDEWEFAVNIAHARPPGLGTNIQWQLIPRSIPLLEEFVERAGSVRRTTGDAYRAADTDDREIDFTIPAHSAATILVDRGQLTMGYPILETAGGSGSMVRLTYAEALYDEERQKGHRDQIEGKSIIGLHDLFLPAGGDSESYTTLWMRTYRYMQVDVETRDQPLHIRDLRFRFSAYPFEELATFSADDPSLADIWNTGWWTARLCAGETYFDCPYYEQLQYVGDTRIQAWISLSVSGDDRLMRKAIRLFDQSRFHEGLTRSRYPSRDPQVIPPYSLFWINMVHDYYMHRPDFGFVQSQRMGVITVLDWYEKQLNDRGLVGRTPYWNFVDWTNEWPWSEQRRIGGVPDLEGGSSILSLQLVYALEDAARLFDAFGEPYYSRQYREWADQLRDSVRTHCWDASRGLFADTPDFSSYSQHANLWAVLTDTVGGDEALELMEKILTDPALIQATFYFKFYLFQALHKTGMANRYLEQLQPWRDMLALGLSTFAEKPDPTRSDCHAWSAAPNYDFLATVCGIRPASPGFQTVTISPSLGPLNMVSASMPHPQGILSVQLEQSGDSLSARIVLPDSVSGSFIWENVSVPLSPGLNQLDF